MSRECYNAVHFANNVLSGFNNLSTQILPSLGLDYGRDKLYIARRSLEGWTTLPDLPYLLHIQDVPPATMDKQLFMTLKSTYHHVRIEMINRGRPSWDLLLPHGSTNINSVSRSRWPRLTQSSHLGVSSHTAKVIFLQKCFSIST